MIYRFLFITGYLLAFGFGYGYYVERQAKEEALAIINKLPNKVDPKPAPKLLKENKVEMVPDIQETELKQQQLIKEEAKKLTNLNTDRIVEAKVSAIDNFVELNEDQRERLRDHFSRGSNSGDPLIKSESIEDVIGQENYDFYKSQRKKAFEKSEQEALEKEVLYLSRQLGMSTFQENQLRQVMIQVEQKVSEWRKEFIGGAEGVTKTPQMMLNLMLVETDKRQELMAKELKQMLTAEQYQAYMQIESESAASELQVWH